MTTKLKKLLTAVILLSAPAFAAPQQDVWNHHIKAWEARDLDAVTSDYSDDAILILNNHVAVGRGAIKQVFAQLFELFDQGENKIDTPTLAGRIVYITWHFTPEGDGEFYGTDTFVIEKGKIAVQTIASSLYDRHPLSGI